MSDVLADRETAERLIDEWSSTRSGAWASRGFNFQHTVGSWLAVSMISGSNEAYRLVPEGPSDVSLEAQQRRHVQVKSRAQHLGQFPLYDATKDIVGAWITHCGRGFESDKLTVVMERGIQGENEFREFDAPLGDLLAKTSALRQAIVKELERRGRPKSDLESLLAKTSVFAESWPEIDRSIRDILKGQFEHLTPAACSYLARELRVVVAETADYNAGIDYYQRKALDRSSIIESCQRFIEQIDLDVLDAALARGICTPLNQEAKINDARFYEGVSAQPGHVAAGLVVPRADLIGATVTGILERSSAILTGPSGVGKSALLWYVPQALPGILWFRVNHLSLQDVEEVLRLCRNFKVSERNPVGLLIDDAGRGQFEGWSQLREQIAAIPGLLMVSTARREDLLLLGDLSSSDLIEVSLNEKGAEKIFEGLRKRGVTNVVHWKQAFDRSAGLTLEFTHLLTQGKRLQEVLHQQVRRRIAENRQLELQILSLAATADRWGASLTMEKVVEACGLPSFEIRKPIERLVAEHILVDDGGYISGVHQLRSRTISEVIHSVPPPTLDVTIRQLLRVLEPEQIRRFIPNLLKEIPEMSITIHETALSEQKNAQKMSAYLRGIRLFDFYLQANKWIPIADGLEVPRSLQLFAHQLAIGSTQLPKEVHAELSAAIAEMIDCPINSSSAELIQDVGGKSLVDTLINTTDIDVASSLLFELQASEATILPEFKASFSRMSPLFKTLESAPISQLGKFLNAAELLDREMASHIVAACGDTSAVIQRIRTSNPWILNLQVKDLMQEKASKIAVAEVLHVSDSVNGDPHDRVTDIARLLLRCLPSIDEVDVGLRLPGGLSYQIDSVELGRSKLHRDSDYSKQEVGWNQERMLVSNFVLGSNDIDRLTIALPLLERTSKCLKEVTARLLTQKPGQRGDESLKSEIRSIQESADQITPSVQGRSQLIDLENVPGTNSRILDPIYDLISDLTTSVFPRLCSLEKFKALAVHLRERVIERLLRDAKREPWYLVGCDPLPDAATEIENDIYRLLSVILDIVAPPVIGTGKNENPSLADMQQSLSKIMNEVARSGRKGVLRRASENTQNRAKQRMQAQREQIQQVGIDRGWKLSVYFPDDALYQLQPEMLVTYEVASLIEWRDTYMEVADVIGKNRCRGQKVFFVPLRNGEPVEALLQELTGSLKTVGRLGKWASYLPEAHETPLFDELEKAVSSVYVISGVGDLTKAQRNDRNVAEALYEARVGLDSAIKILVRKQPDRIIARLRNVVSDLEVRLQFESSDAELEGCLAKEFWESTLKGTESPVVRSIADARLLALEWDIDRENALNFVDLG